MLDHILISVAAWLVNGESPPVVMVSVDVFPHFVGSVLVEFLVLPETLIDDFIGFFAAW